MLALRWLSKLRRRTANLMFSMGRNTESLPEQQDRKASVDEMAKLETEPASNQKCQKRKIESTSQEEEVANKSLILDSEPEEQCLAANADLPETSQKSRKRGLNDTSDVAVKKPRPSENVLEKSADEMEEPDDEELREPTAEELLESEKSENHSAIVSGRQKKKERHQQLTDAFKAQSSEREKQKNEEYLQKWLTARETWKFEKLRQISIQQTMFEEDKLNDKVWDTALKYLAGSQGASKTKIIELANEAINAVDKQCEECEEEAEREQLLSSVKYRRARDLLQAFD